ncbi:uncharacterized protein LOC119402039 [Rhipicephalus sanguineus]|uniref:uncharacterized protein LOC119402039 n=1 Tax=Rhipicephalus sanguineus TaxID=34632 RepID=UPI0018950A34|nr:uncharacterized protein LOC119402039 [Rhipicephalus sanguineus]
MKTAARVLPFTVLPFSPNKILCLTEDDDRDQKKLKCLCFFRRPIFEVHLVIESIRTNTESYDFVRTSNERSLTQQTHPRWLRRQYIDGYARCTSRTTKEEKDASALETKAALLALYLEP